MPLLTCKSCGKIFTSAGGRTCSACLARLDELYPKVREFLRDNPKVGMNVEAVAEKLEADIRDVQALVDMGYLDRDMERDGKAEAGRQKLAQEFENSLKQMKETAAQRESAKNAAASYGQSRYGEKDKKR